MSTCDRRIVGAGGHVEGGHMHVRAAESQHSSTLYIDSSKKHLDELTSSH